VRKTTGRRRSETRGPPGREGTEHERPEDERQQRARSRGAEAMFAPAIDAIDLRVEHRSGPLEQARVGERVREHTDPRPRCDSIRRTTERERGIDVTAERVVIVDHRRPPAEYVDEAVEQRDVELRPAAEVVVDQARSEPGGLGDPVDRSAGVARAASTRA
jgi:hypothetical protein